MSPLLFDQNLSPRLVDRLADLYPNSVHVFMVGLSTALDVEIWEYARANDLMIVTKDADFSELGLLRGFPPKVIWIRRGNCSTAEIEALLRESFDAIEAMSADPHTGTLMLF
jgi:predicted nuclease of predicted toxin-antitoxin system